MRKLPVAAALCLAFLLAGCASSLPHVQELTVQSHPNGQLVGSGSATATATGSVSEAAKPRSDGYLDGYVVDAAIRPLGGATVTATGVGLSVQTGPSGQFKLGPLPEGSYLVAATADGFRKAQAVALIGEGAGKVKFVLDALPSTKPHHETQHFQGFTDFTNADLGGTQPITYCSSCFFDFTIEGNASAAVLEAKMEPNSGGSNSFSWFIQVAGKETSGSGPNPMLNLLDMTVVQGRDRLRVNPISSPLPEFNKAFDVYVTTWYNSQPPQGWSFISGDQ